MTLSIRLLIADDHPLLRAGLRQVIETDARLHVIAEASDGAAALQLLAAHQPDVAVLDIEMPQLTGFALLREMRARHLKTAVVFLTMYRDEEMFNEALDLGALGYVLKDSATTDIVAAIKAAAAGQPYISPAISGFLLHRATRATALTQQRPSLNDLTPTERRVLKLIAEYELALATQLLIDFLHLYQPEDAYTPIEGWPLVGSAPVGESVGATFTPSLPQQCLSEQPKATTKAAQQAQEFQSMDGLLASLGYLAKNPSYAGTEIAAQIPQFLQIAPGSTLGTIALQGRHRGRIERGGRVDGDVRLGCGGRRAGLCGHQQAGDGEREAGQDHAGCEVVHGSSLSSGGSWSKSSVCAVAMMKSLLATSGDSSLLCRS